MLIEGDYLEDKFNNIFTVKGLIHPEDGSICVLRYLKNGDRMKEKLSYRKIDSLREAMDILKKNYPQYLTFDKVFNRVLCVVKNSEVFRFYRAKDYLKELSRREKLKEIEERALELIDLLRREANLNYESFGLSGSCLLNLAKENSDIDLLVYGEKESYKVYEVLKELFKRDLRPINSWEDFYKRRDSFMDLRSFIFHESRKFQEGKFKGKEFFIRFIKEDKRENYGKEIYLYKGYARIKAKVKDDYEAIFTPCFYKLSEVEVLAGLKVKDIERIVSYRGRFCQQAKVNEKILAQGRVEEVKGKGYSFHQMVLGEERRDFMISYV